MWAVGWQAGGEVVGFRNRHGSHAKSPPGWASCPPASVKGNGFAFVCFYIYWGFLRFGSSSLIIDEGHQKQDVVSEDLGAGVVLGTCHLKVFVLSVIDKLPSFVGHSQSWVYLKGHCGGSNQ